MRLSSIIFLSLLLQGIFAQEKLSQIIAPTSPASSVLGLQPKTVLSPKSYQALETSLYSNFFNEDGNTLLPNDFGLEFTPYWVKDHSLSIEEYLYPENIWDQVHRNSSFSLASTQDFPLGDSSSTHALGIGYRNTFYFPSKKDRQEVSDFITDIRASQFIRTRIISQALEFANDPEVSGTQEFLERLKPVIASTVHEAGKFSDPADAEAVIDGIYTDANLLPELSAENQMEIIDSLVLIIDRNLSGEIVFNKFKSYIRNRHGFSLDVAFATSVNFPFNDFEASYAPLQSFWVTPSYRFSSDDNSLKIMGVLRYQLYNQDFFQDFFPDAVIFENNFDYGLSISAEFRKFSLQFEGVGRTSRSVIPAGTDPDGNELFRKEQGKDFQYIGSFSYHISDQFVLTYNLGQRFEPIHDPLNTLVSLLTANFGFGAPTENDLEE